MPDSTYSFLRFHVAGMGFMIYALLFVSPFLSSQGTSLLFSDSNRLVAFVGLVVFLALPAGYLIHQAVVNRYRSAREWRPAHSRMQTMLEQARPEFLPPANAPLDERFTVLDSVLAFVLSVGTLNAVPRTIGESASTKLDERWSHFYARAALSTYSFRAAAAVAAIFLLFAILGTVLPQVALFNFARQITVLSPENFVVALFIVLAVATVVYVVASYQSKLRAEICSIELLLLDRKRVEIIDALGKVHDPLWVGQQMRTLASARRTRLMLPGHRP